MPWTVADVDKHKKGLTPDQKKKWASIANGALASCIKKGGTDESCAPQAIRIANGSVGANEEYSYVANMQEGYPVIKKRWNGKEYLVAPVTMMVEGVHSGSHGPLFHPISELGRFPASWNGIPVMVNHPEREGVCVSANNPEILERFAVGQVFNTHIEDTKLKAEVWLEEVRLMNCAPKLHEKVRQGKPVEVSVGVFTVDEVSPGEWNGEYYDAVAKSHRPDHLALLTEIAGACSLKDGCGIRANEESEKETNDIQSSQETGEAGIEEENTNNNNSNFKQKEVIMANECSPCVKTKVDNLIANSQGKYTEDDREMLQALSEALLDKITEPVVKEVEKEVIKEVQVNVLSKEDAAALAAYKRQLKEKRDRMIADIQANAKEIWPEETLKAMDDNTLERVLLSVRKKEEEVVDYSLGGGAVPRPVRKNKVAPLYPVGMSVGTKKE